ncbi:MAG: threonine--tRNA ligase [Proteobacteria bacterium CG1_02_64_396]|nr:MAG: threonine--tRNA ligase [Proteobacteria bacterium CG1_02_64_396]
MSIILPDQSQRQLPTGSTGVDLAASIGPGLAKAALALVVNGAFLDLTAELHDGDRVRILTARDSEGVEILRHSMSHLLAEAVKELYPEAQVTIGPVIENGFYYDFDYVRPFTEGDLEKIEERMHQIALRDKAIHRVQMDRDDAVRLFLGMGEHYKAEIIGAIPQGQVISLYRQGEFLDLCRGPHAPRTGVLTAFKLLKVAGAYWRGDSRNRMLTRIYGTGWASEKDLKGYLHRLEEAEKRDHRRLAREMDLFHIQEEAPGMIFWHDRGWTLYRQVEGFVRDVMRDHGYKEVRTPQLVDRSLWERSGHWGKFRDEMFTTAAENRDYAVKPMNCPCHIQIFNQGIRSHHDLPLRLAEFGSCHRNEPSGTLHGLMRLRNFVQDDAHIFCTEEQIQDEVGQFIELVVQVYRAFGFEDILLKLSTRPENRIGDDALWDKAETALQLALEDKGLAFQLNPGEGAFYGPKVEFSLKDCLGRVWQCGTIQVDFSMPGRLDASYVDSDGVRKTPVMLHRAILGSLERFIGILIEHYAGHLPLWLAPLQAMVLTVTSRADEHAQAVAARLGRAGIRVDVDLRNEKVGYKIRGHSLVRVPVMLVVGDREVDENTVSVRLAGENIGTMTVDELLVWWNREGSAPSLGATSD